MTKPMPRQAAPDLSVETVAGETWRLAERTPRTFTMIVFYRGYHCPLCKTYLGELEGMIEGLESRGIDAIAVSGDDRERATATASEWGLDRTTVGHGLGVETMRDWGLYLSRRIRDSEPEIFAEPGLFLVRPDGTLHYAAIISAPFARPRLDDVVKAIDFIVSKDYPPRGEV